MKSLYVVMESEFRNHNIRADKLKEKYEKKYTVHVEHGLSGLKKLTESNLKNQIILVSDELLCRRCRPDTEAEEASRLIVKLSKDNEVMLEWDDAMIISLSVRKCLRDAGIRYRSDRSLIELENSYSLELMV